MLQELHQLLQGNRLLQSTSHLLFCSSPHALMSVQADNHLLGDCADYMGCNLGAGNRGWGNLGNDNCKSLAKWLVLCQT